MHQAEAHLRRLEADQKRAMNLFSRGAISREEIDRIAGDFLEAQAAVGVAEAAHDLANLNLEFTKVRAPIAGRLSRRLVDPGNLVKADETALTTIVSLDPLFVYFDVDERTLLRLRRLVSVGKVKTREQTTIPVLVELADEEDFPHHGEIDFSENRVDPSTGTLRVRGQIANPKPRVLSPGLFVRVRLPVGDPHEAILVQEQAMGSDQGKKFVYVVQDEKEQGRRADGAARPAMGHGGDVEQRASRDRERAQGSDKVIVNGFQRVKENGQVRYTVVPPPALHAAATTPAMVGGLTRRDPSRPASRRLGPRFAEILDGPCATPLPPFSPRNGGHAGPAASPSSARS